MIAMKSGKDCENRWVKLSNSFHGMVFAFEQQGCDAFMKLGNGVHMASISFVVSVRVEVYMICS